MTTQQKTKARCIKCDRELHGLDFSRSTFWQFRVHPIPGAQEFFGSLVKRKKKKRKR